MTYAGVVLDIPTRALDGAFDYQVPDSLAGEVAVGATVLVPLGSREVVGYVMSVSGEPAAGGDPSRVRPVSPCGWRASTRVQSPTR